MRHSKLTRYFFFLLFIIYYLDLLWLLRADISLRTESCFLSILSFQFVYQSCLLFIPHVSVIVILRLLRLTFLFENLQRCQINFIYSRWVYCWQPLLCMSPSTYFVANYTFVNRISLAILVSIIHLYSSALI